MITLLILLQIAWLVTYPCDVVKTRLQSVEQEVKPKYTGFLDCIKKIHRIEGTRTLFAGVGATAIRGIKFSFTSSDSICLN